MRQPREFISAKWAALLAAAEHLSEARTLDAIVEVVRNAARGISGSDGITFVLRDGEHCHYVAEDAIGPLWVGHRFKLEQCVSGWAMLHGQPALIPDIYQDPRVPVEAYRPTFVKSLLMTPVGHGEHAAAIGAYWAKTGTPDDDVIPLMTLLARYVSAAMDNGRLLLAADAEIAARRGAESELLASNARFSAAVDAVSGVLWTNSPEGKMEGAQPGWSALTGQTHAEYSGYGWSNRVHPDDAAPTIETWEAAVATRSPFIFEHRVQRHDASWGHYAVRAIPVLDGDGAITEWVGVHTDITEQRESEAALLELNATLEQRIDQAVAEREAIEDVLRQAQKMEAVGQLTGGIAHDFNNLLTIIMGNMEMVARKLGHAPEPSVLRALTNAQRGAERAATLTQRLLAFARRQPLAPKPTDVGRLIAGMSDLLTRSLGETVSIETVSGAGLWMVEVDQNQLESAIINLAVNARDAMHGSGNLTVEVQNTVIDRVYAAVHTEVAAGPYVVIAVTDTGMGMAPDVLARAFDPFFTTKEVGKGTGLGLSQVYGFVKQSGGHVKIYSEPGQGTSVKIYLPRFMGGETIESEAEPVVADRGVYDETILVVEDDDDVRAYTVEILRELGYRVLEAHDGPTALRLLERQQAEIDLLFTDVVMPGMTGRELADAARRLYPHLLTLFSSGYTRNSIIHGGRLDQGIDFLAKPFTFSALALRVREILDRGELNRILFLDADDSRRLLAIDLVRQLGFTVEPAASAMETLGKLRSTDGGFDVVVLDASAIEGDLDGLIRQIHAVRKDLPVLIAADADAADDLAARHATPCIGFLPRPYDSNALRAALGRLRVRCRRTAPAG